MPGIEHLLALPAAVTLSLVISLDGQLCGRDGSSRSISGPEDLEWLRRLRASVATVIVGAATAEAERYQPIVSRPEYVPAREAAGLAANPDLVIIRRTDDFAAVLHGAGTRVLLEAGVRLHTALADAVDRVWLSHSPTLVGDGGAAFAFPMEEFALTERWGGRQFAYSRFERVTRR